MRVEAPGRGDVVAPGRGRQPVEVVIGERLGLRNLPALLNVLEPLSQLPQRNVQISSG
jgi:hypothetical protein